MRTIQQLLPEEWKAFEQSFEQALDTDQVTLQEVLHYIHLQRGKQLRPQLVLLSAAISRGVTDKTISTAVALELLHTATLVHDDVVDHSPMRRGKAAIQEQWTNKVAVLVGDYILAKVIEMIDDLRCHSIVHLVAKMGQVLSKGELSQLHAGQSMWISEKQYFDIIHQKTAELFGTCAQAGAQSCLATGKQEQALRAFGMNLGMCFQLKDDILDYSDSEELGKPTMSDICDGKVTLPLIISLQRATKEEAELIRTQAEALGKKEPVTNPSEIVEDIKSFVLRYQGVNYAYKKMEEYRRKAIAALDIFRESEFKQTLLNMLDYAIHREW